MWAAILTIDPLASGVFWCPMAVAFSGGLLGATVLTHQFRFWSCLECTRPGIMWNLDNEI